MPSHAAANPAIQQMYINGRFCYAFKFGIVTNGLGIVRHISFYNKDFLESHPEIIVEKKSASPDVGQVPHRLQSTGSDAEGFLSEASLINPMTFLGDAAFDSIRIYKYLLHETSFVKAYIPLKNKLKIKGIHFTVNADGIPCCPHDVSLPMKREGACPIYAAGSRP